MYKRMAKPLALRFLLAHKDTMCREIPLRDAFAIMCEGMKEADQ